MYLNLQISLKIIYVNDARNLDFVTSTEKKMLLYDDILGAPKHKYLKEVENLTSQRYETFYQDKTLWKANDTYVWQLEDRTDDLFCKKRWHGRLNVPR